MLRITLILALLAGTGACSRIGDGLDRIGFGGGAKRAQTVFDGVRFRSRLSTDSDDKRAMTITVTPFAVNPEAALEAGRYKATVYCLRTYGGSDTEWQVGPDTPLDALPVTDDTITLRGRCIQR